MVVRSLNGDLMVINPLVMEYIYITDWWFGTWLDYNVPIILGMEWNVIIPADFHSIIFQRGRAQPPSARVGTDSWDDPAVDPFTRPGKHTKCY